jgi:3-dehydroquinate synthase
VTDVARVPVVTAGGSYEVSVGPGLLSDVGSAVGRLASGARCFLVTDDNVADLYGVVVEASLRDAGVAFVVARQTPGEASKNWHEAGSLLELMAEEGFGRDSVVLALGGGVVGDIAGFVASAYMRGIPVIQVPTTLLAQVDSSIGGKTGVDLRGGKNLAGAFWQPLAVLADTSCLATLPSDEWRCGFAEVVKSAILAGEAEMDALERSVPALLSGDETAVTAAVLMAAGFKAGVVGADEREASAREQLNYGHTLGHALERELGYGTISHGAAVAEGVRFAAALAVRVAGASPGAPTRRRAAGRSASSCPQVRDAGRPYRWLMTCCSSNSTSGVTRERARHEGPGTERTQPQHARRARAGRVRVVDPFRHRVGRAGTCG